MLLSMNARIHKATTTDANGRFRFDSLMFADSAKFAIQAKTKENSDHAIITLDSIPKVAVSIKPNIADVAIIKTHLQQAVQDGKPIKLTGHILKQVNIKAIRNEEGSKIAPQGLVHLPDEESADQILRIPDPESYITLATYLQGRLAGIRVEQDKNGLFRLVDTRPSMNLASNVSQADNNGIGIVLDGIPLQPGIEVHDALTGGVLPEDIDRIDVVRTNLAMVNLFGKALFIIRKAKSARKHYTPNIVNTIPKGFNWTRQFYSPHYDHPADNTKPDTRTTIYWNPYVNTDASGKATINFYNADGPGNYRVVIEGINAAGELGRQVYHYKVE
jgi:hypothetical protein